MPLILPGNVGSATAATGYDVANSVRFNSGDSPTLKDSDGNAAPAGNRQKFTWSIWFKRSKLGVTQMLGSAAYSSGDEGYIYISGGDVLVWHHSSSGMGQMITTQKFMDVSAWYHLVWAVDTTQGTASNRMKFYINGTQITSFGTETYPDQNKEIYWNVGGTYYPYIGRRHGGDYWDGYLAEVVQIDDSQLAPDQFGEFDSNSGIWKPIDVSGLTFGTSGYYLDFEDSSDLGKDVSGVGNHFASTNLAATDQSTDTCTNNFTTMNILDNYYAGATFSEGNLQVATTNSGKAWNTSTIALSSGKWYFEAKNSATGGTHSGDKWNLIGISDRSPTAVTDLGVANYQYAIFQYDGKVYASSSSSVTYAASWDTGDTIGCAIDLDNSKIYWSKNGAWGNGSGAWDSSTFNASTGAVSIQAAASTLNGFYFVAMGDGGVNVSKTWQFNFGSPMYAISSGNTDGNGYGNFEYAVPSGYFSLNTKNLAEYG